MSKHEHKKMSEHQGEITATISARNACRHFPFSYGYAYSTGVVLISQVRGGMK